MRFPTQKTNILSFADTIIQGLTSNSMDFPDPPFQANSLFVLQQDTRTAILRRQAARAQLKEAVVIENERLSQLNALIREFRQSANGYQPDLPENFLKIMSAVHSNPRLIPLAYLRRFGILL
ncbi:MAG: hypothetical protein WC975_08360 [Phycisphaerae bacterium]